MTTSNKTSDKWGEPTQVPSAEDFKKYLAANPGTIIYNSELKLAYPSGTLDIDDVVSEDDRRSVLGEKIDPRAVRISVTNYTSLTSERFSDTTPVARKMTRLCKSVTK